MVSGRDDTSLTSMGIIDEAITTALRLASGYASRLGLADNELTFKFFQRFKGVRGSSTALVFLLHKYQTDVG